MSRSLCRRLLGAAAVAVLAFSVSTESLAAPVPAETYPKAIEADIAHLEALVELAKTKKGIPGRMKSTAMLIAAYAQENLSGADANKMAALREAALKVAEAVAKKDTPENIAKAVGALKNVTANANADKKPMKLATLHKLDLHEVMDLFGSAAGGGMNIEKDIRDGKKGVKDAKAAELIGIRSAMIAELAIELPPAFNAKMTKEDWEKWNKEMKAKGTELATEAAKGAKADANKMTTVMKSLDATCVNCHNVFRD